VGRKQVCSSVLCVHCTAKGGASGFPVPIPAAHFHFLRWARCVPRTRVATSHVPHRGCCATTIFRHPQIVTCRSGISHFPIMWVLHLRLMELLPLPMHGPRPIFSQRRPKSGITDPLPNLNLTTFPALRRRRLRKEFWPVDGPLRRRHRPLALISLHTPTVTSESRASDTPPRPQIRPRSIDPQPCLDAFVAGLPHTATFPCRFPPYSAHLWR